MTSTNDIRSRLIDSIMTIENADYLIALEKMIAVSQVQVEKVALTEEQRLMLTMSDADIQNERTIDQEVLNEQELEWLKEG